MKVLLFLPLLFAISSAVQEVKEDKQVLIDTLKKIEGSKIQLPKELIEKLMLDKENIDERLSGTTAVVDDYVDKVLTNINKFILKFGLDPAPLENATLNLVPTGTITLTSGWLQDLSTLQRNGNVTVGYSSTTKTMEMNLPIKLSVLLVTYKYETKVLLLTINGDANAKIEDLIINIKLSYDYSTYQVSLDTFDITDTGRFSLKFSGNDLVDWITNTMTSVVTLFMQPLVVNIVQAIIKGGLQSTVDAINQWIISIFNP